MHRTNGGHDGDFGNAPRSEFSNLARPVRPHLRDEDLRAVGQVFVDRPREARAVVETARRRHYGEVRD